MKPYLSTTGILFLLITGAHVFEMIDRGHVEASDVVVLARTLRVKAAPGPSLAWLVP